jgi:hypothetical protein
MSEIKKDKDQKDISTEYIMKFLHEDAKITGFLHGKIIRIRNIMKAWKTEIAKEDKDSP